MMGSGWMFGVMGMTKHIGLIGRSTLEARIEEALQGVVSQKAGQGGQYQSIR